MVEATMLQTCVESLQKTDLDCATWSKEVLIEMVCAILIVLRNPTKEMIAAGEKEFFEHMPDATEWSLLYTTEAFQEMIDVVIAENKP